MVESDNMMYLDDRYLLVCFIMKRHILSFLLYICAVLNATSQVKTDSLSKAEHYLLTARAGMQDNDLILNPVTDFDCADPSVVKIDDWFTRKPYFAE